MRNNVATVVMIFMALLAVIGLIGAFCEVSNKADLTDIDDYAEALREDSGASDGDTVTFVIEAVEPDGLFGYELCTNDIRFVLSYTADYKVGEQVTVVSGPAMRVDNEWIIPCEVIE